MMNRNIPNSLTLLRILIVPFFIYLLFYQPFASSVTIAFILFIVGSITDYLDGFLARKHNIISDFGKIMDPLADKLLVLSALAALTWMPPISLPIAIFWIIFLRELLISVMREIYKKKNIIVPADKLGKIKTVMQMLGIICSLFIWAIHLEPTTMLRTTILIWFWAVTAITVLSGMNYLIKPLSRRKP